MGRIYFDLLVCFLVNFYESTNNKQENPLFEEFLKTIHRFVTGRGYDFHYNFKERNIFHCVSHAATRGQGQLRTFWSKYGTGGRKQRVQKCLEKSTIQFSLYDEFFESFTNKYFCIPGSIQGPSVFIYFVRNLVPACMLLSVFWLQLIQCPGIE